MKAYTKYTNGESGDFAVGVSAFLMDKATVATFTGHSGITFQLTTTNEPQVFDIGIAGINVTSGTVVLLG